MHLTVALLALHLVAGTEQPTSAGALQKVASGSRPAVDQAINEIQYLGTPQSVVTALVKMALGEVNGNPENAIYALAVLHPPEAHAHS